MIMIIMGSLHADRSFTDSLKTGVIHTSCSLVDRIILCRVCDRESGRWSCDVTSQAIYDVIALLVTVTWTAVGTHFIADLYLRKNYNTKKPNQDTCDFDVYWFSFAVILIGWVAVCLAVAYIINKHGRELL